jgi:disulfide bond formation protein DsbB
LLESPKAHLHATGIFGTLIDRTVQLPEILPGQSIDFSQVWKNMPPFEIGTLHLDVTDGSASPPVSSTAALSLTLIPWLTLLVVALAVLALLVGLVFWRRRKSPLPVRPRREPTKAAAP